MKNYVAIALLLVAGLSSPAQILNVKQMKKVATPLSVDEAVISPDGQKAVVSTLSDESLSEVAITSGKTRRLVDCGTTFLLQFTDDSRQIVYIENSTNADHRRFKQVKRLDLDNLEVSELSLPTRTLSGIAVKGQVATVVDNARSTSLSLATPRGVSLKKVPAPVRPSASIHYGQLLVTAGGTTTAIDPNGTEGESYLWPSVSPDGTRVLYYRSFFGAYVCNIDGSNPVYIGVLRAPAWVDDQTIVGMFDTDDGQFITSSSLIAASLDGRRQTLTPDSVIAMSPTVSADGKRIAFTTPDGALYYLDVEPDNDSDAL